ncbi:hypothetical protein NE237_019903 [Protea cynaroides]|uniref:Uncharacterized protein n=1 Tax=Protea cynaroides TaxID=273540 RepID=A0A9Q0H821_9MAGN|nr:hypothetical protein NE237_019903 [Protea cynaroides]
MSKNQKNQHQITQVQPLWKTTTTASRTQAEQSLTRRTDYYNKEDGSYGKDTTKVTHSSGAFGRGGLGHKEEYKVVDKHKVGDSKGYTEYYTEERFRTVQYGNTKSSNNNSNRTITYDNTSNNTVTYDDSNYYSD